MTRIFQLDPINTTDVTSTYLLPIEDDAGVNTRRLGLDQLTSYLFDVANNVNGSNAWSGVRLTIGVGASQDGYDGCVVGPYNYANYTAGTAVGYDNTADGNWGSSAMGYRNYASYSQASAFGHKNHANDRHSNAFGTDNTANGESSSAFGSFNTVSGYGSNAFGYNNFVSGDYGLAVGYRCGSYNAGASFGRHAGAYGNQSLAMGHWAYSLGAYSVAAGKNTNSQGNRSVALGSYSSTSADDAIVLGANATALNVYSTAIGSKSKATPPNVVNFGSPIVIRAAHGDEGPNPYMRWAGAQTIFMSNELDFTASVSSSFDLPTGTKFYVDEVGVICDTHINVTGQPTVAFGFEGNSTGLLASTTATLGDVGARARFTSLLNYAGHTTLSATTSSAIADDFKGRVYWKGQLVESQS